MSARSRLVRTAIALTVTLTAGTAALTGCGPTRSTASGNGGTAAGGGSGGGSDRTAAPVAAHPHGDVEGTAHNGLTISDGTRYVLMNGTRVDFGTEVRDLAWSPDGRHAAFVDGAGDLVVSDPDGGHRVVVARDPGGQTWSHPTWQVTARDTRDGLAAKDNLLFAAASGGVSRLDVIAATAVDGTPKEAGLNGYGGDPPPPATGNVWPTAGGTHGSAVYANTVTGEVYLRDDNLRQQGSEVTRGSEPAMSPTADEEIVFVRSVGGHDHLFLETQTGRGLTGSKDLTPDAGTDYTEPAWSPDGTTIAARTPAGVVTLPADGSAAPTLVVGHGGLPAYRG